MKAAEADAWRPRDGGLRGWLVVVASFCVNGLVFGLINSYSVIYVELQELLILAGETDASSKAALVGSLTIGGTFALSPVAGILTDRYGLRQTTLMGGSLAVTGMLLSSFLTHKVEALYLTYGILFGVGASLAYTPSLAVLCLYFRDRLGMVNGFVTAGSSVFTMVLPPALGYLIPTLGLPWVLRLLALIMAGLALAGLLFVPPKGAPEPPKKKAIFNCDIWTRKKYVIWAVTIPLTLLGYFVPYVHMVKLVDVNFPGEDGKILVMCIGLTSGLGRVIFGKLADLPRVDRILLQQVSFVSIGVLTMLMIWAPAWGWMIALALGMGLFDGCFISLIGPIAFDLCGPQGAAQGIGFLLGLMSMPMTVGPPLAGLLYDHTGSYQLPFIIAGIPPILGGIALSFMRCVRQEAVNGVSHTNGVHKKTVESASLLELDKQQAC